MFEQHFFEINRLLVKSKALWQVASFECDALPWEREFPALAKAVWSFSDEQIEELDVEHRLLVESLLPALKRDLISQGIEWELKYLCFPALKQSEETEVKEYPSRLSAGVKGRKWQQITLFSDSVMSQGSLQSSFLEWCSGKGHLGRLLAFRTNRLVTSLEWQSDLSRQGQLLSDKFKLHHQHICGDAFKEGESLLKQNQHAVALHACGDLHVELLKQASEVEVKAITIAPCCYHLIKDEEYQALSKQAKSYGLQLSKTDLRLPLQQSVIANEAKNKMRLKEMAWRLGFDSLQRQVRQRLSYLPIPTIKQAQLSGTFKDFCSWAADQKQLCLPININFEHFEQLGVHRQKLTRRIDLVAHLFRQAIEYWLLLDRCLYLQEQGYEVELSEFCHFDVTPRNKLIRANVRT
ncbi:methyltransferase [Parashewanella curva]|uniref:Methyltransferase n=1 Tax=Parashewanella curva TaxID=2338552 RepID=A0A3L8PXD1_9GAMM|nr:methyltransferase [Parashewanella curva]RLV60066.1 methyltransferase [Parashewanella curva]